MFNQKSIAAVVPCYNEESQIVSVINEMPEYVDHIVVIDDCSNDRTIKCVTSHETFNTRTHLIRHQYNQGVGGAIASGYKWCRDHNIDIAVVMAGDGQMSPVDLPNIIQPVASGIADYSKGNRLIVGQSYKTIPLVRFIGNTILSLLTKVASGYWHISDSQTGYTAISKLGLNLINWDKMYKRYGQPNDLLVKLNVADLRVVDVPMQPVYNVGEKSGIRVSKVIPTISFLLARLFFWRLKEKYVMRGLHPLIFFYAFSFISGLLALAFFCRLAFLACSAGIVPEITLLLFLFSSTTSINALFFAMLFDYQDNKELNPRIAYSSLERYFR